jgi:hypothetical protein
VARNFPAAAAGADIAFSSDLPPASGMSSSSAFMVAVFLAVATLNDLDATATYREAIGHAADLAGYLGTVENGRTFGPLAGDTGVGTFGGSEDHTAILCCRASALSQYRFAPVQFERDVPMPAGHVFAVAFSGLLAEKTGAALATYNRASHAAAIYSSAFELLSVAEDVGRHNALDKAIGKLFLKRTLHQAGVLILSSRISYELVQKAARAKIPFIFAASRPTALAVQLADSLNMTLASPSKGSGIHVYCGSRRLAASPAGQ